MSKLSEQKFEDLRRRKKLHGLESEKYVFIFNFFIQVLSWDLLLKKFELKLISQFFAYKKILNSGYSKLIKATIR